MSKRKIDRTQIPKPGKPRPFNFPEFSRSEISNGLKIITAQKSNLPLVNVLLYINASPLDDQRGAEGELNMLAQLLLEGTKSFTSTQIADQFERLGAQYSAHVAWNGLFIEINVLKEHLVSAFSLMSDVIQNAILPDKEFDRIRDEIMVDRLQVLDIAGRLANEHLFRQLFPEHRYGLPIEGTKDSLPNIRLRNLRQFYRTNLPSRSASLIFTGDVSPEEAFALSKNYLGEWSPKVVSTEVSDDFFPSINPPVILVHKPGAAQAEVRFGQFFPERKHPDFYRIKLMNEILGGYFLSRLNLNLREKNGFTYSIHSNLVYRPSIGIFTISAAIQNDFVAPAIQEIFNEIERLQSDGVTEEELQNARGYLTGVFPNAFETIDQISDALANIITFDLPADYYRTFREKLQEVTVKDIHECARGYLTQDEMQVVLVGDRDKIQKQLEEKFDVFVLDVEGNPIED